MIAKFERWYPLTSGLVLTILYCNYYSNNIFPALWKEILLSSLALSSTAIGFLVTAMSILFTISNSYVIKQVATTKNYDKLINYFLDAINWLTWVVVFSFIGFFVDAANWQKPLQSLGFSLWFFSLVTSGLSSYRAIRVLASVLRAAGYIYKTEV